VEVETEEKHNSRRIERNQILAKTVLSSRLCDVYNWPGLGIRSFYPNRWLILRCFPTLLLIRSALASPSILMKICHLPFAAYLYA
jgi:hypothetical protein